jgi:hypothetical protein
MKKESDAVDACSRMVAGIRRLLCISPCRFPLAAEKCKGLVYG